MYLFWAIILLTVGLALAVLELFIPSAGLFSVGCVAAFAGSLYYAFSVSTEVGLLFSGAILMLLPMAISAAIKVWPHTRMGKRVLLDIPTSDEVRPDDPVRRELAALVGKRGRAASKMLPSGAIEVEGQIYDALTEGVAVEPGEWLEVVAVQGTRVVVRTLAAGAERPVTPHDVLSQPVEHLGIDPDVHPLS
ncbi:MAG: hypothetical protein K1X74_07945 [Pirellulales bacterium]|nr:hypothetical protein [Pirellulales bacterium]